MFRRQRAVPVEFDTTEPSDVEDCIEIDTSSPRGRGSSRLTEQTTKPQRSATDHLDARQHEATGDDGLCCSRHDCHPRHASLLQEHLNDPSSSSSAPLPAQLQETPPMRNSTAPTSIRASSINDEVLDDAASDASDPSSGIPTDVAIFFDHAGEASVWRERISEHWFAVCERIAAEHAPSEARASRPTEAEEATMKSLQNALDNAEQKAAKSQAVCLAQGINPDTFRYRRMSETSS